MSTLTRWLHSLRSTPTVSFCDACSQVSTPAGRAAAQFDRTRTSALSRHLPR